mmetsp:Transcript_9373/g.30993  ORF Transcript_9373/g.30993 Transcript_9373/m.30993 type:complete len:207 (+) Transcript_9373:1856-2476(+)
MTARMVRSGFFNNVTTFFADPTAANPTVRVGDLAGGATACTLTTARIDILRGGVALRAIICGRPANGCAAARAARAALNAAASSAKIWTGSRCSDSNECEASPSSVRGRSLSTEPLPSSPSECAKTLFGEPQLSDERRWRSSSPSLTARQRESAGGCSRSTFKMLFIVSFSAFCVMCCHSDARFTLEASRCRERKETPLEASCAAV